VVGGGPRLPGSIYLPHQALKRGDRSMFVVVLASKLVAHAESQTIQSQGVGEPTTGSLQEGDRQPTQRQFPSRSQRCPKGGAREVSMSAYGERPDSLEAALVVPALKERHMWQIRYTAVVLSLEAGAREKERGTYCEYTFPDPLEASRNESVRRHSRYMFPSETNASLPFRLPLMARRLAGVFNNCDTRTPMRRGASREVVISPNVEPA
jgi:hypothetical protein